ncbi:hypothetical protein Y032_0039g149 [Ancylostoma ceylanicum]|uniref:Uncharacterized protein n=1 Tax=Ancylostoma ceylanicum TaxID=53326 RepID=A0A016UIQ2_9BILA|nr:hypothetical protein Y032_0039g149 [Ancylostoma ceylanicum]
MVCIPYPTLYTITAAILLEEYSGYLFLIQHDTVLLKKIDGLRVCTIAAGPEGGMQREHASRERIEIATYLVQCRRRSIAGTTEKSVYSGG